jgi:hypothetical protein
MSDNNGDNNDMTRFTILVLALLVVVLFGAQVKAQDQLIVAVSPHVNEDQRQSQGEAVIRFLAEAVKRGESAVILNAYDLTQIGVFSVPDNRAYENPRAKVTANRAAIAGLLTLQAQDAYAGTVDYPIDLPGLLRYVAEAYRGGGELVIIGSPLYDMPREAHLSMAEGGVPGDGLIQATRGVSAFGAAGAGEALSGYRVHFAAIDPDWALHDRHAFAVERFLTLLIEANGGQLVSFAGDLATVFDQVSRGEEPRPHGFVLEETDKREILYFRPNTAPRALARDMSGGDAAYTGGEVVNGLEIGLYWTCEACDLDLYVVEPGGEVISYINREPGDGLAFYKNLRSGPDDDRSLEVVILDGPIDLNQVSVGVNLYSGHSPEGATGELRFTVDGHTYVRAFRIAAETGNYGEGMRVIEGAGSSDDAADSAWVFARVLDTLRN